MEANLVETVTETKDKVTPIFEEHWMVARWRPLMAYVYMAVIIYDFILADIFNHLYSVYTHTTLVPWHPLTLEGSGLFHVAMGAVLGVSAWTRGQEKIERAASATTT